MRNIAFASALILCTLASAQEFKPFPRADITQAQWQAYYDEVSTKHQPNVQIVEAEKLIIFNDPESKSFYAFTQPGHPAHPAWITRKLEVRNDNLFIGQIGYFAGDEPQFARLFKAYLDLNEKLREASKQKPREGSSQ
jgi:hypothetical protein